MATLILLTPEAIANRPPEVVTLRTPHVRAVWSLVSADPALSREALAKRASYAPGTINRALNFLIARGIVGRTGRSTGTRPIYIPFTQGGRDELRPAGPA